MGTKNNPGKYDCYNKAEPDEPMFVLLGRDPLAPDVVRFWAARRGANDEKALEALACAKAMELWQQSRKGQK